MNHTEQQAPSQISCSHEGNTLLVKGSFSLADRRPADNDANCFVDQNSPKFKTKKWLTRWAEETHSAEASPRHASYDDTPYSDPVEYESDSEKRVTSKRNRADARARDIAEPEEFEDEEEDSLSSESDMAIDDEEFIPSSRRLSRPRSREIKRRKTIESCDGLIGEPHEVEESVKRVLAKTGVSPESIVRLINNKEDKSEVIKQTGFSKNYIMKLQRKVLRSSKQLQLKEASVHMIGNTPVHVLFDSDNQPLFIKKELCQLLDMKGTTFSYWKKKASVQEIDTSQSFRLMDQCRTIFGGRSTYTMYKAQDTLKILSAMETSRQRNFFSNLPHLKQLAIRYLAEMEKSCKDE